MHLSAEWNFMVFAAANLAEANERGARDEMDFVRGELVVGKTVRGRKMRGSVGKSGPTSLGVMR